MCFRVAPIAIPLVLVKDLHVPGIYVLVIVGLLFTHLRLPIISDWIALSTPENHRARFVGQRWLWLTLMAILAGFVYGGILDHYPEGGDRYAGFAWVFLIAFLTGIGSYAVLLGAPAPRFEDNSQIGTFEAVATAFKDRRFRRLLAFRAAVYFSSHLAIPFYSVFMIKRLGLSYTTMALYGNVALVAVLFGNRALAGMVDRFGSKPVMQVMLVPGVIAPVFWALSTGQHSLVMVAMVVNSLMFTAINLAESPLLWDAVPAKGNRAPYFALYSMSFHLSTCGGSIVGGILASQLPDEPVERMGVQFGNLQIIFLLTALAMVMPILLLTRVEERKAQPAMRLISQVGKGNPFSYVFNAFLMNFFTREGVRAWAAAGMARSGSPMAAVDLIEALDDISPQVRRRAVEGLGLIRAADAAPSLMDQMRDGDSDIRAEAAEALGKIQHPLSLDALVDAMGDPDSRVRISAIRALGEIGGDGVREYLYQHLGSTFDRQTFPTLIDALSRLGDRRIVPPAIERLPEYASPVIRAQILNSVCRALGAGDSFYQLAILDELKQATRIAGALGRARKQFLQLKDCLPLLCEYASPSMDALLQHCEEGRYKDAYQAMIGLAKEVSLEAGQPVPGEEENQAMDRAMMPFEALAALAETRGQEEVGRLELLFATVCTCTGVEGLREAMGVS
jgi:MFS family permease